MKRDQFIRHVEGCQREFRRFLVALCCGDSALADDIAQESFMKAYLSCEGLNDPAKFKSWIYRIGYHSFLNHKRSARLSVDYEEAKTIASAEVADGFSKYEDLYAALDQLPPAERTSVLLYYIQDYSVKEIAQIVEVSEAAVRQHLSRGRNHLRGLLK